MDGWKFRRQASIGPYVVDFVCFAARLVVELDGNSHDEAQFDYDERRQTWLESQGFTVLRLSADDPEIDPLQGAWEAIDLALTEISNKPRPLPPAAPGTSPASGEDMVKPRLRRT
jgi:very-short-patch-repair endonuclease